MMMRHEQLIHAMFAAKCTDIRLSSSGTKQHAQRRRQAGRTVLPPGRAAVADLGVGHAREAVLAAGFIHVVEQLLGRNGAALLLAQRRDDLEPGALAEPQLFDEASRVGGGEAVFAVSVELGKGAADAADHLLRQEGVALARLARSRPADARTHLRRAARLLQQSHKFAHLLG